MKTTKTTKAKAEPGGANELRLHASPDKSNELLVAELAVEGMAGNALTLSTFVKSTLVDLSLSECMQALKDTAGAVHRGDLRGAESLLVAQAAALNAMFGELARRSAVNMGQHLDAADRYMRLALKAQGQCRATLETLAAIKNPPTVFARQANINNGGQQQVNNGAAAVPGPRRAGAHAANSAILKTELLEASDEQGLDNRAAGTAGGADPHLETVGAVNRPAHR